MNRLAGLHPLAAIAELLSAGKSAPATGLMDLTVARDHRGHPLRLTTWRENRRLVIKRRRAKRFIARNSHACLMALSSVLALRRRPQTGELFYLVANSAIPTCAAQTAATDLGS